MKIKLLLPEALINIQIALAAFILFFALCPHNSYSQTSEKRIVFQDGAVYDASSSRIVHGEARYDQKIEYNELKFIMKDHDEALRFLRKSKRQEYVMKGMLAGSVAGTCITIASFLDVIDVEEHPALVLGSMGAVLVFAITAWAASDSVSENLKTAVELYNKASLTHKNHSNLTVSIKMNNNGLALIVNF